jgi:hypothetical protein
MQPASADEQDACSSNAGKLLIGTLSPARTLLTDMSCAAWNCLTRMCGYGVATTRSTTSQDPFFTVTGRAITMRGILRGGNVAHRSGQGMSCSEVNLIVAIQ